MADKQDTTHTAYQASFTMRLIRMMSIVSCSALYLSACQTITDTKPSVLANDNATSHEVATLSDSLSSNYLMARHAIYGNDLPAATAFFTASLVLDDKNIALLRHSFLTQYQSGNIEQAAEIARRMESLNFTMPLASEPALIEAALINDWDAVVALSDLLSQSDTSLIIAGVARSWALYAQGQFAGAVTQMSQTADLLKNDVGLTPVFMELQIAYLLEAAGKTDEALSYLSNLRAIESYPPHIQLSLAAAYHRLGMPDMAQKLISSHLSASFDSEFIAQSFATGDNSLLRPMTVRRGLAQALLDTSWLDTEKSIRSLLLARAHLSLLVEEDFEAAHFVIAQEFLALGQRAPATKHLEALKEQSAYFLPSNLSLISYLRRTDRHDEALRLARNLRTARPANERLLLVESDILRSLDRCEEALPLYKALLNGRFDTSRLHRNLAICLERSATNKAQEDEAERYFLSSLERDPNDAYTLNYLGYWYADTNRNLDKAISYIQKAVKLRPSSGYFVDSLGWVYYRLHDYEQAVEWLEKAIQLEPLDPVITDHLGDAYWQVGRTFEAVYKWRLAYAQSEDEEMRALIAKKLEAAASPEQNPLVDEPK